jgi:hypothetical protein
MVFLVERAPEGRRGLMRALTSCGACGGILLGSAVGAGFAAMMPTAALESWGWRIPFLLGLVVGIAGYFLRRHVLDTVPAEPRKRAPIVETLHDHWRIVVGSAGLSVFNAVGFYVSFIYLVSWLDRRRHSARARTRNQLYEHGAPAPAHDRDRAVVRPHRAQAGAAGRNRAGLRRRDAGVLAAEPPFRIVGIPRPARADRNLWRHAADHHGRGRARTRALHGGGARLQHLPRSDRRLDAPRRHLAGQPHRRRDLAGVPDHGGGRRDLCDHSTISRDLSRAFRRQSRRSNGLCVM